MQPSENVYIPFPKFLSDSYIIVLYEISYKLESLLTLHIKNFFECIQSETFDGSMSLVLKGKVSKIEIKLILVYCKIVMEEEHFLNISRYSIISTKPNIVLCDFNFNYQNNSPISSLMQYFIKFMQANIFQYSVILKLKCYLCIINIIML